MSQVSGSIVFEFPTERVARLVAAEIIEHIGRPDVLNAIAAAIVARMSAEAGGFPLGGRHQGTGDPFYDRESEG